MNICNFREINTLVEQGEMIIESTYNTEQLFLDDFRMGFHLNSTIKKIAGSIDLKNLDDSLALLQIQNTDISSTILLPGEFYLGYSQEKISMPLDVVGFMYTRSKYARLGLEMFKSANVIAPGYSKLEPSSIIFEITTSLLISGLSPNDIYCFVVFYKLDKSRQQVSYNQYGNRFPFSFSMK